MSDNSACGVGPGYVILDVDLSIHCPVASLRDLRQPVHLPLLDGYPEKFAELHAEQ